MRNSFKTALLIILILFGFIDVVYSQGLGLGTASPTEILHLFREGGDVAVRYQAQASGTGPQGVGPSSSGTLVNDGSVGAIAWSNPTNAAATDNTYATATIGTSNYLKATNFGFAVPGGATINSITVEVEKSYANNPVTLLDAWSGNTTTSNQTTYNFSYPISAGTNRVLVVIAFQSNNDGDNRDIDDVTYDGVSLTKQGEVKNSNNDDQNLSVWTFNEAQIAAAGGTTLEFTWSGRVDDNQFYYAATYQYVDQTTPFSDFDINTANSTETLQLQSALNVNNGDMVISTAGFGNDNRTLGTPSGFTNILDLESASGQGASWSVSTKAISATGTEQPTTSYTTGGEDMSVVGLVLNNAYTDITDNVVSLYSGGALIGVDKASATVWTSTDTYTTYGGVDDWGGVTEAQINAGDFGVVISASVGGTHNTAQIDHVRITVVYTSVPAVYTEFDMGIDESAGKFKLSESSALGTSDVFSVTGGVVTFNNAIVDPSDIRYKKNVEPLDSALTKVLQVEGVTYNMRTEEFPEKGFTHGRKIGFIAQDWKNRSN